MPETVYDRDGSQISLTEERWEHIIEFHEEMQEYREHVLTTLRRGQRRQDPIDPTGYSYVYAFDDLEEGYTHVVVIVKFGFRETAQGTMRNNFVLTAYQKMLFSGGTGEGR